MGRFWLITCALLGSLFPGNAQQPPQPPKDVVQTITASECADWKTAIRNGHTLTPEEQIRYAQCPDDAPHIVPKETYVPSLRIPVES